MIRRLNMHGMLLMAAYWFGICTYLAFMVTALVDYGWSTSAATGAITAMSVVIMIVSPIYGYISDKYFSEKKLLIILLALSALFFVLLPFSLRSGSNFLVLVNMVGVTITAVQSNGLIDSWIVGLKQEFPEVNYGLIRGTGSLTFALSAQVAGILTTAFGHGVRFWLGGTFFVLALLIALSYRPARRSNLDEKKPRLSGGETFKIIFSSKQYCLLLAVSFFLILSSSAMVTLVQLLIPEFGGTTAQVGTAFAVMAGSEVPMMFLMALIIKKLGYKKVLVFTGAAFATRMFITANVASVNGIISIQLLQGLTFAVLLPVSMSYLSEIVDERVRTTAVTTFAAITASFTGILGNLFTSTLLANGFTAQNTLIFFAFSALIGFILTLYGWARGIWEIQKSLPL